MSELAHHFGDPLGRKQISVVNECQLEFAVVNTRIERQIEF